MGSTETAFNTHPQPRTFAPSKEDVLQNLQYFFGAPVSPEKLKDYVRCRALNPRIDASCCSRAACLCACAVGAPRGHLCAASFLNTRYLYNATTF